MVDAQTLTSQVLQGYRECKLDLHLAQCSKVLNLTVFHLQNVEETYITTQHALQLPNIPTWLSAILIYCIVSASMMASRHTTCLTTIVQTILSILLPFSSSSSSSSSSSAC
jgi:uncharacterized membrane protein YkvI